MTVFSISQSIFYSKKLSKLSDEKRTFLFSLVPPFPISKQNAQQATPHTFPPPSLPPSNTYVTQLRIGLVNKPIHPKGSRRKVGHYSNADRMR